MNKRKIKKEEILEAGSKIMYQKGYNGTGVKEIVDAAGIPKGSFYNYFDSKEDFAIQALCYVSKQAHALFKESLDNKDVLPLQRIENLFLQMTDQFQKWNFSLGCFVGNLCQEMADNSISIGSKVENLFATFVDSIAQCLQEAQKQGELSSTHNPRELAEFIFNSWEGALMRMKASKNARPLELFQKILKSTVLK